MTEVNGNCFSGVHYTNALKQFESESKQKLVMCRETKLVPETYLLFFVANAYSVFEE